MIFIEINKDGDNFNQPVTRNEIISLCHLATDDNDFNNELLQHEFGFKLLKDKESINHHIVNIHDMLDNTFKLIDYFNCRKYEIDIGWTTQNDFKSFNLIDFIKNQWYKEIIASNGAKIRDTNGYIILVEKV